MAGPIKLRRLPPPSPMGEQEPPLKRPKIDKGPLKGGVRERFFIGDGRLQRVMDSIFVPNGFPVDLIDLIGLYEFDTIVVSKLTSLDDMPVPRRRKYVQKHFQDWQGFVEHILWRSGLTEKRLQEYGSRGSIYVRVVEESRRRLAVCYTYPLSKTCLKQLLTGEEREAIQEWTQTDDELQELIREDGGQFPILFVHYEGLGVKLGTRWNYSDFGVLAAYCKEVTPPNPFHIKYKVAKGIN